MGDFIFLGWNVILAIGGGMIGMQFLYDHNWVYGIPFVMLAVMACAYIGRFCRIAAKECAGAEMDFEARAELYKAMHKDAEADAREAEIEKTVRNLVSRNVPIDTAKKMYETYKRRYMEKVLDEKTNTEYPYVMKEACKRYLRIKGVGVE
jgi:hypothetical protein